MTKDQARQLVWSIQAVIAEVIDNRQFDSCDIHEQECLIDALLNIFGNNEEERRRAAQEGE